MMFVPKILPFAVILMLLYFTEAAKWTSGVDQTRRETKELTSTIDRKRRETSGWTSGNRPSMMSLKRSELSRIFTEVNRNSREQHSGCFVQLAINLVQNQGRSLRKMNTIRDSGNVVKTVPTPGDQNAAEIYILLPEVPVGTRVILKGDSAELIEKHVELLNDNCTYIYVSQQDLRRINYNTTPELEIGFPIPFLPSCVHVEVGRVL